MLSNWFLMIHNAIIIHLYYSTLIPVRCMTYQNLKSAYANQIIN